MTRYADIGCPVGWGEDDPGYVETPDHVLCSHAKTCKAQLMALGNVDAVLKHGCILTGDGLEAEACWQWERRRRALLAKLYAGFEVVLA